MLKITKNIQNFASTQQNEGLLRNYKYYQKIFASNNINQLKSIFKRSKIIYKVFYKPFSKYTEHTFGQDQRFYFLISQKKFLKFFGASNQGRIIQHMIMQKYFVNLEMSHFPIKEARKCWSLVNGVKSKRILKISMDKIFKFGIGTFDATYTLVDTKAPKRNFKWLEIFLRKASNLKSIFVSGNDFDKDFLKVVEILKSLELKFPSGIKFTYQMLKELDSPLTNQIFLGENKYKQIVKLIITPSIIPSIDFKTDEVKIKLLDIKPNTELNYEFISLIKLSLAITNISQIKQEYFNLPNSVRDLSLEFDLCIFSPLILSNTAYENFKKISILHMNSLESLKIIFNSPIYEFELTFLEFLLNIPSVPSLSIEISNSYLTELIPLSKIFKNLHNYNPCNLKSLSLGMELSLREMKQEDYRFFEKLEKLQFSVNVHPIFQLENIFLKLKSIKSVCFEYLQINIDNFQSFLSMFYDQLKVERIRMTLDLLNFQKGKFLKALCESLLQIKYIQNIEIFLKNLEILSCNDKMMIQRALNQKFRIKSLRLDLNQCMDIIFQKDFQDYKMWLTNDHQEGKFVIK